MLNHSEERVANKYCKLRYIFFHSRCEMFYSTSAFASRTQNEDAVRHHLTALLNGIKFINAIVAVLPSNVWEYVENPYDCIPTFGKDAIILVAQYAYETRGKGDLRFKKHDRMLLLDDSNADWWYVQHLATKEKGYVPRDFVACGDSLESEEWYHKRTTRLMAEMHLSKPSAPRGTFLIRERKPDRGKFALTIKDYDEQRGGNFKHYKIARSSIGRYYIKLRES